VSRQVNSALQPLADAIDNLDLPIDSVVLTEAFALVDRLNAKLLAAVAEHDATELWRNDGATSMTAWLRHHTRQSGRDAAVCTRTAHRLRELPVTAAAYRDGALSGGQVQAIVANLKDRTVGPISRAGAGCSTARSSTAAACSACYATPASTGCSWPGGRASWTTGPPPAPSPPPSTTPWSSATAIAASPAVTGHRSGVKPIMFVG
jgi:Domain of unknown function (DUF222)